MSSKIRLGWFIPLHRTLTDYNRVLASVWIRCLELVDKLSPLGYQSTINQPWAPMDIAIFLRVQGSWPQRIHKFLKWRGVKTIYTAVVNYYELEGNLTNIEPFVSHQQMRDCVTMTQQVDAVITVSKYLKNMARQLNPNVIYLPDTVTREHFRFTKSLPDFSQSPLKLIWAGHGHKAQSINEIGQLVRDLPVELTVIADTAPKLAIPYNFVKWRYETFPHEIVKGDICISPRTLDNSYDKGHSNFKIMVFLAQGVPALVSPQGSYLEVIQDEYNGFICHSLTDWQKHLQTLINDRQLLCQMSGNALQSASSYLTNNILSQYDAFFQKVLAGESVS